MQVVVTGGGGFLGSRLIHQILTKKRLVSATDQIKEVQKIISWDSQEVETQASALINFPSYPGKNILAFSGDVCDENTLQRLFTDVLDKSKPLSVFHLASMMSGQGEQNFDECFEVNVNGTRRLLDACRNFKSPTKFVFTSSIAAAGPTDLLSPSTRPRPQSTYGVTKAIAEMLVCEYSRRGFVDGRVGRLPTVIVRPGPPNAATTGSFSNIVKAMIQQKPYTCPIPKNLQHPVIGYQTAVTCLRQIHEVSSKDLKNDRVVNLPAVRTCLNDIETATREILLKQGTSLASEENIEVIDKFTTDVVKSMASSTDCSQAKLLGLHSDENVSSIIQEYVQEFELC